jgi:DNA-binding response OmpR family regulator
MGPKILVVDDDLSLLKTTSQLLHRVGFEVVAVADGITALARIAAESFNLVITDLRMPGMMGDELATCIRQKWPELPIIMITGFPQEMEMSGMAEDDVDALILKPFSLKELENTVRRVLNTAKPADFST